MKKFTVHYNYYATADVVVFANSKEEAIEKADQIELDNNDFELDFDSREVFESEDANSKGITGATDKPCGEGVRTLTQNCC